VINNVYPQVKDVLVQHNTVVPYGSQTAWGSVYFAVPQAWRLPFPYPPSTNVWVLDNVLPKQPSGDWGVQGMAGLNAYMGAPTSPDVNTRYYGNVMYVPVGNKMQAFPPHNYATTVPIVYANQSTADYQLVSPYWTDTSDGQLAGVNFTGFTGQSTGKKAVEPGSSQSTGKRR